MGIGVEGQGLTAEDQLFILTQAGLYLTATRGLGSPEARICYERAESLCHSLDRPLLLYVTLIGQWRYSLLSGDLPVTMQIAQRVYSLAQDQSNSALMIGACRALACTLYFSGDFDSARQYAMRGLAMRRAGGIQCQVEEVSTPAVGCLCYEALSEWHLGEIASCHATMAEAISLAKELNDMHGLAAALFFAAALAHYEHNAAEVERCASNMIELSTRENFALWLAMGAVYRGWARSALRHPAEGISWIDEGIEDYRATGAMLEVPYFLALKAEALYLRDRTSEALEAISEAEALVERFEGRWWRAEIHRLRGVFLTAIGAEETQIDASFCEAIKAAKEQKSITLQERAERTYAEYRRQKASVPASHGFRLPLC